MASQGLASQSGQRLAALPIFALERCLGAALFDAHAAVVASTALPGESLEGYRGSL